MDSKVILAEIQKKNHFVFRRLFDGLYHELVVYANGYLFDKDSSEDVVQEVFVCLWEKSNKIDIETNLKSYLYAMVRNRCFNILKAIKITHVSKITEAETNIDVGYSPDWFPEDEKHLLYEQVLKVIDNFPLKMRNIAKLRFVDNYRFNEIADELDVSVNTVKTQLRRAKLKLGKLVIYIAVLFSIVQ
ncbi:MULTISPECIES: sigma-70 family RNA polymerase sigma factor [Arenibacter]|uniref:RNA polymerase sigma factor n=1 Tax=Arenibacter TaxID=178469 RepID=UPI001C064BED|nr:MULTISPECIES: sigma-70 family RNA polymerase sigma factor [Arenibacter]MBU2904130.1 sigma-70 family RNA polymerase sigma factor [Arenibacter algicola]MCK0134825.1 sigma-70 family RNA polymerase sigma factor [Arenibacter sp. S6351L]